jgi:anti-sigma B factor antagonist
MAIQMDTHEQDGVTTVRIRGDLDYQGGSELRELLKTLTAKATGRQRIVLDLSQVPFIDSYGLLALISGQKAALQQHGELVLSGVTPQVRRVLQGTRLDRVFTFADSAP